MIPKVAASELGQLKKFMWCDVVKLFSEIHIIITNSLFSNSNDFNYIIGNDHNEKDSPRLLPSLPYDVPLSVTKMCFSFKIVGFYSKAIKK
jgi:hypothetical protein